MARSRDLWIILRARDEASRVFRGFSRNMSGQMQQISQTVRSARATFDDFGRSTGSTVSSVNRGADSLVETTKKLDKSGIVLGRTVRSVRTVGNQTIETFREYNALNVKTAENTQTTTNNMKKMRMSLDEVGMRLDAVGRVATLAGASMMVLGGAGLSFAKSAIDVAAEYDRQARRTLTQVDGITASLEEVAEVGRRVAREIGTPFETLQDTLFFIFSSMDVNIQESEQLLRGFAKEAVAGQTDIESAARTTIAIMNALQVPVSDLTDLQDIQFQVIRKGIISYDELSRTIGRALPATARAGQNFETLGAMMAFMTRNGLSAAMASTSAARALESFAHPTVVGRLEDMGIAVRDQAGEYRPLLDVMRDMNTEMSDMAQPERTAFLQELFTGAGGTIQARRFWDLAFKNFDDFETMVGHMENSSGAFEDAYANMADSVAARSELMRNKWMLVKEAIGNALMPVFIKLLDIVTAALDWFDRLPASVKGVIAQFIVWGSVISIVIGAILLFVGMLAFLIAGIIMAGKVLVIVLAVMTVVIGAILAFAGAMIAAWHSSENFRGIIRGLIDWLKFLWGEIKIVAGVAKTAFTTHILPALEKLWDVVNNKVLPVVSDFLSKLRDELMPVIQDAGRRVAGILETGFRVIGETIEDHLIPAIEKLITWYHENQDTVNDTIGGIRRFASIMLWVAGTVIGGLIGGIALIIWIVSKLIEAFLWVLSVVRWLGEKFRAWIDASINGWNMLVSGVKTAWGAIVSFFSMIWNWIVGIFIGAFEWIKGIIEGATNWIMNTIWVPFWNTFGGIITGIFDLVIAIVRFYVVLFQEIWNDWILGLVRLLGDLWGSVSEWLGKVFQGFVVAWTAIKDWLGSAWEWIKRTFNSAMDWTKRVITTGWNNVKNITTSIWNGIKSFLSGVWNGIKAVFSPVVRWIRNFWDTHLSGMWNKAKEIWNKIVDWFRDKIAQIKGFFSGARTWLVQAGKDFIQGLLDGINAVIGRVTDRLNSITDSLPDWKGPPEKDRVLLYNSGQLVMRGFLRGIDDQIPMIMSKLGGITSDVGNFQPMLNVPTAFAGVPETSEEPTINNQYITINTNEIDPVVHSEQIGFLLQARGG